MKCTHFRFTIRREIKNVKFFQATPIFAWHLKLSYKILFHSYSKCIVILQRDDLYLDWLILRIRKIQFKNCLIVEVESIWVKLGISNCQLIVVALPNLCTTQLKRKLSPSKSKGRKVNSAILKFRRKIESRSIFFFAKKILHAAATMLVTP